MESTLQQVENYIALILDAIAVMVILIGATETLLGMVVLMGNRHPLDPNKRGLYVRFAQWLVVALTFQLAADIVKTTVAPTWDDIGRVAAIAVIRTFLTYFLDRDLERAQEILPTNTVSPPTRDQDRET